MTPTSWGGLVGGAEDVASFTTANEVEAAQPQCTEVLRGPQSWWLRVNPTSDNRVQSAKAPWEMSDMDDLTNRVNRNPTRCIQVVLVSWPRLVHVHSEVSPPPPFEEGGGVRFQ